LSIAAIAVGAMVALTVPAAALGSETETEQSVAGALRDADKEPLAGVTITVTDADGAEVGATESDDAGQWEIPVPSAGVYSVELDVGTLPEGVALDDPASNPAESRVLSGQQKFTVFRLSGGTGGGEPSDTTEDDGDEPPAPDDSASPGGRGTAEKVFRALGNGLKVGLILAMAAVGLSLIFGTTGMINFAHGELVALGAMLAWYFNARSPGIYLIWAALLAIAITGALGAALESGLFRPLRARRVGLFQRFIITIGLALIIRHVILLLFGGQFRAYVDFVGQRAIEIGPFSLTPRDLTIMALAIVILLLIAFVLERTRIGKAIRAVRDNPALAAASGIDVDRITLIVWSAGAALAATGGVFWGSAFSVDWEMGFRLLLLMFAAVILGGIGTAYGAMAGGITIGLITEISTLWFPPELKYMWGLLALILILLVRPQGMLGRAERVG
jgi:branched-chain amino acid transport system permease protein